MIADYALDDEALLARCRVERFRAQGPGGQHTNRTDSAVRLTHVNSGVVAQSQDHRDQRRNTIDALARLRIRLAIAIRGESDPTWLQPHRRGSRLQVSPHGAGYPLAVAVLLDALESASGSLREAADHLALSSSQFVNVLIADKDVHAAANALRTKHGLGNIHG